ncbi:MULTISPECIES: hypothetical protein [Paenibacillus]
MSKTRSKNTALELIVRRHLHSEGFRYKLHDKKLPGKPDVILPKYKTVVFYRDVSGMLMKDANIIVSLKRIPITGLKNSMAMS